MIIWGGIVINHTYTNKDIRVTIYDAKGNIVDPKDITIKIKVVYEIINKYYNKSINNS